MPGLPQAQSERVDDAVAGVWRPPERVKIKRYVGVLTNANEPKDISELEGTNTPDGSYAVLNEHTGMRVIDDPSHT